MANTATFTVPPGEETTVIVDSDCGFDSSPNRSGPGFLESLGTDESLHRLSSFRGAFTDCDSLHGDLSSDSLCGSGDLLTSRLDVYCGGTVSSTGNGTPSIVRFKNGVIQWASLPRNKRSTTSFSESLADSLLDSPTTLPLDLIITAKIRVKANKQGKEEVVGFTVLGAQANKVGRNGGPLLSTLTVHFTKASAKVCQEWVLTINNGLLVTGLRPRKLLFFINPMAGKGDAALIYQQSVRPYLKAADIEADVMLLNGPGSMRKYLSDPTRDVQQYDGIVAVGGDGTINELINISIFRAIEVQVSSLWSTTEPGVADEVAEHEFSIEQIRKAQHRIGVIPAGQINHIASSVFGSDSPTIATIHTLLGGKYLMDVCSLSSQKRLLTFGTTAVFSCLQHGAKSPKCSKRKLLRLSSSQQLTVMKNDRDGDFYASLRYQVTAVDPGKPKPVENWSNDQHPIESTESLNSVHPPLIGVATSSEKVPLVNKWASLMGTYGYLCIFATPYRDPEHPGASSQEGLLDLVVADTLSRKDYFRNALKKKFTFEQQISHTAVLCHAKQAFINITVPGAGSSSNRGSSGHRGSSVGSSSVSSISGGDSARDNRQLFRKKSTSVISSPFDMVKARHNSSCDDSDANGETGSSSVESIGTIYSSIDVDVDVTIGHLKRISWSSIQSLAGEPQQFQSSSYVPPGMFAWYIDGDPIDATSVHVCILPKIVNFLAMPLDVVASIR